jgi:LEA14-like dessication related protein
MKRVYIALIVVIVLAAVVAGAFMMTPKPQITFRSMEVTSISLLKTDLNVTMSILNTYPVGGVVENVTFTLYYPGPGGDEVLGYGSGGGFMVPPGVNQEFSLPVTIDNLALIQAGFRLITQEEVKIRVKGSATLSVEGVIFTLPFDQTTVVTLPSGSRA